MSSYADRLKALREQLQRDKLDGFVVPLTDEHMSEYVGSYAQRLAWLTGFEGSAGSAVVLPEEAAIFVDGRYTLQVRSQVERRPVELSVGARDQHRRLAQGTCAAGRADRLRPVAAHPRLGEEGEGSAGQRAAPSWSRSTRNPIDEVWKDRPEASKAQLVVQTDQYAGKSGAEKRTEIGDWLAKQRRRCRGAVGARFDRLGVQRPRRRTSSRTPVALAYALVNADGTADLFVAGEKIGAEVRQHLGNGVRLHERARVRERAGRSSRARPWWSIPSARSRRSSMRSTRPAPRSLAAARPDHPAQGDQESRPRSPARSPPRPATARPFRRFLHWIDEEAPKGEVDELKASDHLEALRRENRRAARPVVRHHFRRRARMARSSITGRARRPTASWSRARSI